MSNKTPATFSLAQSSIGSRYAGTTAFGELNRNYIANISKFRAQAEAADEIIRSIGSGNDGFQSGEFLESAYKLLSATKSVVANAAAISNTTSNVKDMVAELDSVCCNLLRINIIDLNMEQDVEAFQEDVRDLWSTVKYTIDGESNLWRLNEETMRNTIINRETKVNELQNQMASLEAHLKVVKDIQIDKYETQAAMANSIDGIEVDMWSPDDDANPIDTLEEGFKHSFKISQLLRDQCLSLQGQLSEKSKRIFELSDENSTMRIEGGSASKVDDAVHAKLEGTIEAAKAQMFKHREDMKALRADQNSWMQQATGLQGQIDAFAVRQELLINENSQLRITAAEHLNRQQNADLHATQTEQRMESERSILSSRIADLQKESKLRADQANSGLTTANENLQALIQSAASSTTEIQTMKTSLDKAIDVAIQRATRAEEKNQGLEQQVEGLRQELSILNANLDSGNRKISELSSQLIADKKRVVEMDKRVKLYKNQQRRWSKDRTFTLKLLATVQNLKNVLTEKNAKIDEYAIVLAEERKENLEYRLGIAKAMSESGSE